MLTNIVKTLEATNEYQFVTSAKEADGSDEEEGPSLFEQQYSDSAVNTCSHCMSMRDLSLVPCPVATTCTVKGVNGNYLYFKHPSNKLTRITKADNKTYELIFKNIGIILISGQ